MGCGAGRSPTKQKCRRVAPARWLSPLTPHPANLLLQHAKLPLIGTPETACYVVLSETGGDRAGNLACVQTGELANQEPGTLIRLDSPEPAGTSCFQTRQQAAPDQMSRLLYERGRSEGARAGES
ncbi:hypothetical protein SKAU_G00304550 [Synaphobranchus kaupii]|uniref:Uncharacterized protein n=1 Tax=Synaphobranchus kaupii TaxID=118154 RepID=A0A9Q1EWH8_SYNKA|nr:hypothetical protein SKAU_G00304550 [Synaphobranchus kaupii]